jgi:hypothetical protein
VKATGSNPVESIVFYMKMPHGIFIPYSCNFVGSSAVYMKNTSSFSCLSSANAYTFM